MAAAAPSAQAIHFRDDRLAKPRGEAPAVTRLLVQFRSDTNEAAREQLSRDAGGRLALRLRLVRALAVAPRDGVSLDDLRARLRSSDRVLRVEDDAPIAHLQERQRPRRQRAVRDQAEGRPRHRRARRLERADELREGRGARHRRADQPSRPASRNLWENTKDPANGRDDDHNGVIDDRFGGDLVDGKGSGDDQNGHGTHVAGIIGARGNNDRGIAGLCWSVKIVAVRVLDADGRGNVVAGDRRHRLRDQRRREGHQRLLRRPDRARRSSATRSQRARSKGVLIVAAAGNDGVNADKTPVFPAAYPDSNILSVAATNSKDKLASFSNYGAKTVDLAAPGDHIASTFWHSDYAYMSGTSMAAPYVAAAAAMLRKEHSSWSIGDISSRLRKKGDELKALKGKTASGRAPERQQRARLAAPRRRRRGWADVARLGSQWPPAPCISGAGWSRFPSSSSSPARW